jgi:hypothetical protein
MISLSYPESRFHRDQAKLHSKATVCIFYTEKTHLFFIVTANCMALQFKLLRVFASMRGMMRCLPRRIT